MIDKNGKEKENKIKHLIECNSLELSYEGRAIVKDLSFSVDDGDCLMIVGANGSGKSTLVRTLLGLKSPSGGSIGFGAGLKGREIGYMPQQSTIPADFPASVWEVVISGCLNQSGFSPFYSRRQRQIAEENLRNLGIEDLKQKCYRELSGGQKQRVLLARALCATSKLILLDEPTTGLDPAAISDLYDMIKHLNRDHGISVVMVSHDIRNAISCASHVLHLTEEGSFFGTAEEYVASPFSRVFIKPEDKNDGKGGIEE